MAGQRPQEAARAEKKKAILKAALSVFIKRGYGDATIDEIVSIAGGSKATVYKYFKSKEDLFTIVVDEIVVNTGTVEPDDSLPPALALTSYSETRLKVFLSKEHIALRRLIIGESLRFPRIAWTYYQHGPENSRRQLERYFRSDRIRKTLRIDDPGTAAMLFQSMLMHPITLHTLFNKEVQMTRTQVSEHVKLVVDKFIRLYKP